MVIISIGEWSLMLVTMLMLCYGNDRGGDDGGYDDHHCWLRKFRTETPLSYGNKLVGHEDDADDDDGDDDHHHHQCVVVFEVHPRLMQSDLWPNAGQETEHQPLSTTSS